MALVTVHRSPSPSCESREVRNIDVSSVVGDGDNSYKTIPKTLSFSESYLIVKGAAVILPQTECIRVISSETGRGDIQAHLQMMLYLLRVQDRLKLAVKLESRTNPSCNGSPTLPSHLLPPDKPPQEAANCQQTTTTTTTSSAAADTVTKQTQQHCRYMALVSAPVESSTGRNSIKPGWEGEEEETSIILGVDICDSNATVGLVLPVWGDCAVTLDGDGGFNVSTNGRLHNFKPVSVQAMWAALQCLTKARDTAGNSRHLPIQFLNSWANFYSSLVTSDPLFLTEWHTTLDSSPKEDGLVSLGSSALRPADVQLERMIRTKLKQVMMTVDLEEVTSKYLRDRLEEDMGVDLTTWKRFIDDEMIIIMRQMDAPSEIFPYLYLGSEWNASNIEELQNNKVGHILNVTKEIANFYPEKFEYSNIRIFDEDDSELLKHWENTYKFIIKARESNSNVLVHCKMGVSRSASTVIAFVMKELDMGLEEAMKYVKSKRSCIQPNKGFKAQLETYEGILDASKKRHSHLWKTPSLLDLQDSSASLQQIQKMTGPGGTGANVPSSLSPPLPDGCEAGTGGSCNSKTGYAANKDEIAATCVSNANYNHGWLLEQSLASVPPSQNVTFYIGVEESPKSATRSQRSSSSSSSAASASAPTRTTVPAHQTVLSHENHSSLMKAKSYLSLLCVRGLSAFKSGSGKPAAMSGFTRSRSVSPKMSIYSRQVRDSEGEEASAGQSHDFKSRSRRSASKSLLSSPLPFNRSESVLLRVRPDNFWIKQETLAGSEPDNFFTEINPSEACGEESLKIHDGKIEVNGVKDGQRSALIDEALSGLVKKTTEEIEKRGRVPSKQLERLKREGITENEVKQRDTSTAIQRSFSCKLDRPKVKEQEVERRRTCPPMKIDINNWFSSSSFVDARPSKQDDSAGHSNHTEGNLHDFSPLQNCRHMSIPDCYDETLYKFGCDVFKLENGKVSKTKKEFESLLTQEQSLSANQLTSTETPIKSAVKLFNVCSPKALFSVRSHPFSASLDQGASSVPTKKLNSKIGKMLCKRSLTFDREPKSALSKETSLSSDPLLVKQKLHSGPVKLLIKQLPAVFPNKLTISSLKPSSRSPSRTCSSISASTVNALQTSSGRNEYDSCFQRNNSLPNRTCTELDRRVLQDVIQPGLEFTETEVRSEKLTSGSTECQRADEQNSISSLYLTLCNDDLSAKTCSSLNDETPTPEEPVKRSSSLRVIRHSQKEEDVSQDIKFKSMMPSNICQRHPATFHSALIVVPSCSESESSDAKPAECKPLFLTASNTLSNPCIHQEPSALEFGISKPSSNCNFMNSKKSTDLFTTPFSVGPVSSKCRPGPTAQRSFCHFSIPATSPDHRDSLVQEKSFAGSDGKHSSSFSKPTTPTYHMDQSLVCN